MKQKLTTVKLLCLVVLLHAGNVFSQNQSRGLPADAILPTAPSPVLGTETFRFGTGIVTQLENQGASLFGFTAADQWHSIGRINGAAQTVTGFRAQRAGRGLLVGFQGGLQNTTTPSLGDPFIQWRGNSAASVSPGNLEFRSFTDPIAVNAVHRFSMRPNGTFYFGRIVPTSTNEDPWVQIDNQNINVANSSIGIKSTATKGAVENIGVYGLAFPTGVPTTEFNYGVRGESSGPNSYGVYGQSNGFNAFSVGVYGTASGRNSYAGFFDGDVYAAGIYLGSDMKLKKILLVLATR